jgi:hypothetical protein
MRAVVNRLDTKERILSLEKPEITQQDIETLLDMASLPHVDIIAEVKVHSMVLMQVVRPATPVVVEAPKPWYRRLF